MNIPTQAVHSAARPRPGRLLLAVIVALNLALALYANGWGTPDRWHPDEMDIVAADMASHGTLNPHSFPYGGWHYYILAIGAALPVELYNAAFDPRPADSQHAKLSAWRDRKNSHVKILARSVSAVLGAAIVVCTYLMADGLYGASTALLASLFMAVAPYFVLIEHFSTVDVDASFWYWLSCLFSLNLWKRNTRPWYALAAFTAGLATGTKVDRLLALIPLALAGLWRELHWRTRLLKLLRYGMLVPVGYAVANPTMMTSFFEFLDGTTRDLFFNMMRGTAGSQEAMLAEFRVGLGLPLCIVVVLSLAFVLYEIVCNRRRKEALWLLAAIVPSLLLFGSRLSLSWYLPFFFPGLVTIAAYGCVSLARRTTGLSGIGLGLLVTSVVVWCLCRSVTVDLQFENDSRYLAARWIRANIPEGSAIEIGQRGPRLPAQMYAMRPPVPLSGSFYDFAKPWRDALNSNARYQALRNFILTFERSVDGHLGLEPRPRPYQGWFDRIPTGPDEPVTALNPAPASEYRVLVDYVDGTVVDQLQRPDSGYRLLKSFHYDPPGFLATPFPFVNPVVYIFKSNLPGHHSPIGQQ